MKSNRRPLSWQAGVLFVLAFGLTIYLIVIGGRRYAETHDIVLLSFAILGAVVCFTGLAVALQVALSTRSSGIKELNSLLGERLEQFSVMLNVISEQQLLSERAKAVAYREKDREALRRAIREEIAKGQFDAALLLVNEMENTFGYKQEAGQLRAEIGQQNENIVRRSINEVVGEIDRACAAERWDDALSLGHRLCANYPEHELCRDLPQNIQHRKDNHKQQLLIRWRDAVARKDLDGSVEILRQLDMYVTPQEVAELKDGALEMFKARIEHLREDFKLSVQQRRWQDAINTGQDITTEFPTSKLAQEVRDMMPMLRERSGAPAEAEV